MKLLYFTTLGEALRRLNPTEFSNLMIERQWVEGPRRHSEILEALDPLFHQVWYNRHITYGIYIEQELINSGASQDDNDMAKEGNIGQVIGNPMHGFSNSE
ncbi:MAG: hypothetical protein LAP85_23460 [Acidobacteriia bacterium]|nr:hypothetical protein [Terriglobia bacterium]